MGWVEGKRLWITGASSGIGRSLAVAVAAAGGRVILSGRSADRLEETAKLCRGAAGGEAAADPVEILPFDVADPAARREALAGVAAPLHGLINNAGVSQRSLVSDTSPEVYEKLWQTNMQSAVELTLGALPLIRAGGEGRIVAVSSIAAELYGPLRSGYGATKAAMNAFFYSLRTELWEAGIRVTVVIPGFLRTDVSKNALTGEGGSYGVVDRFQANGLDPDRGAPRILAAVEKGRRICRLGMTPKLRYGLAVRTLVPALFDRVMRNANVT